MATRRHRFKPTAILLSRRQTPTTTTSSSSSKNTSDVIASSSASATADTDETPLSNEEITPNKLEINSAITSPTKNVETKENHCLDDEITKLPPPPPPKPPIIDKLVELDEEQQKENTKQTTTSVKPSIGRRIIKPTICLPTRKKKLANVTTSSNDHNSSSANNEINNLQEQQEVVLSPQVPTSLSSPTTTIKSPLSQVATNNSEQNQNKQCVTKEDDDNFKSPFMSPSIHSSQQQKRFENSSILFNGSSCGGTGDRHDDGLEDSLKYPLSPAKVRQRIRPTPHFHRRNSTQGGNVSESEEETTRRQRHLSSSSTNSLINLNFTTNRTIGGPVVGDIPQNGDTSRRIRTTSVCSNMSDVVSVNNSKQKRVIRSEECMRIARAKKEFENRFHGLEPDKARLTMFDMIYYNPIKNPMKSPAIRPPSSAKSERRDSVTSNTSLNVGGSSQIKERRLSNESNISAVSHAESIKSVGGGDDASSSSSSSIKKENVETMMPVPQLKLGPNGEIILDEKSLVIETTGDKEARETLANADIVYDDEFSGTSGFYKRSKRTRDWSSEETIKFYRCLHTIGTDFSLMLTLFPNRNRRDLKLKFKKEEKLNGHLINKALLYPKQFNIDELKVDLEEEELERQKYNKAWEEAKKKRAKDKKEFLQNVNKSKPIAKSLRSISDSKHLYEYEFVRPPKRRKTIKQKIDENRIGEITLPDVASMNDVNNQSNRNDQNQIHYNSNNNNNNNNDDELEEEEEEEEINLEEQQILHFSSLEPNNTNDIQNSDRELFNDSCIDKFIQKNSDLNLNSKDILNMEVLFIDNGGRDCNNTDIIDEPQHPHRIIQLKNENNSSNIGDVVSIVSDTIFNENINTADDDDCNNVDDDATIQDHPIYFNDNVQIPKYENNFYIEKEVDSKISIIEESSANINYDINSEEATVNEDINESFESNNNDENNGEEYDYDNGDGDGDDEDENNEDQQNNEEESLVVVARPDPTDLTKVIHEVFIMSPITGQLSEEPLDLPDDVIERIRASFSVQDI